MAGPVEKRSVGSIRTGGLCRAGVAPGFGPWACSRRERATVEADGLAGDPPGLVRCQPQAGCTDIVG